MLHSATFIAMRFFTTMLFVAIACCVSAQPLTMLRNCEPGAWGSNPRYLSQHPDGKILFSSSRGTGLFATWISDGTAVGTQWIGDIFAVEAAPIGNRSLLKFADGGLGATDGTDTGTHTLHGPATGLLAMIGKFCVLGGQAFFIGEDSLHGRELWTTDGTIAGTRLVKDINPGTSPGIWIDAFFSPYVGMLHPISLDSQRLIFLAQDGLSGTQFWITDGSDTGTHKITNIDSAYYGLTLRWYLNSQKPAYWHIYNGKLFFVATGGGGTALWSLDGTPGGTTLVKQLHSADSLFGPGVEIARHAFAPVGNQFIFAAPSALGRELWISDGTTAGTSLLKDVAPGTKSGSPIYFTPFNGKVLFSAVDTGGIHQTWITDGTAAGTMLLASFTGNNTVGSPSYPVQLPGGYLTVGARAYFSAHTHAAGRELWYTDGTAAGTAMCAQINPGTASANPSFLTYFDGMLVLIASTSSLYKALLRYDPTADTFLPVQSSPTALPASAEALHRLSDSVLFLACDSRNGAGIEPHVMRSTTLTTHSPQLSQEAGHFAVWPNPARETLHIRADNFPATVTIADVWGRVWLRESQRSREQSISIAHLPMGVYFLTLQVIGVAKTTKKIVVR